MYQIFYLKREVNNQKEIQVVALVFGVFKFNQYVYRRKLMFVIINNGWQFFYRKNVKT